MDNKDLNENSEAKEKKTKNSLTKNISLNSVSIVLQKGIAFFLTPVVTRIMTPDQYGFASTYTSFFAILACFLGVQAYSSIQNAILDYDKNTIKKYLSSIMSLAFSTFVLFLIVTQIFANQISELLQMNVLLVRLMAVHCFGTFCVGFVTTYFTGTKQVLKNLIINLVLAITISGSSILLAYFSAEAHIGYLIGTAIPNILFGAIFFVIVLAKGKCFFDKKYWKYCIIICLPLIFHVLSSIILNQMDRIMLRYMIGESSVGVYTLAYNFVQIIAIIWSALNAAYIPFYFDDLKAKNHERLRKNVNGLMKTMTICCAGFIFVCPEVVKLMSEAEYWIAIPLMPILAVGIFFTVLYNFASNYEYYYKKNIYMAIGTILASAINIGLNYLLIPKFDIYGAAIATAISYVILFIFHDCISRFVIKQYPIKFKMFLPWIALVLSAVPIFYLTIDIWWIRWTLGVALAVYYLITVIKKKALI